jgi:hypothetical protein
VAILVVSFVSHFPFSEAAPAVFPAVEAAVVGFLAGIVFRNVRLVCPNEQRNENENNSKIKSKSSHKFESATSTLYRT